MSINTENKQVAGETPVWHRTLRKVKYRVASLTPRAKRARPDEIERMLKSLRIRVPLVRNR